MGFHELDKLAKEIAFLRKSNDLLEEVSAVLGPYVREINGTDIGDLAEKISAHLHQFDDGE